MPQIIPRTFYIARLCSSLLLVILASCGGGGGSDNNASVLPTTPTPSTIAPSSPQTPVPPSSSVSYYVAPTGSDSNAGTVTAPWRTLQFALSQAQAGTTIQVRAGVYAEQINFPRSGNASAGYIILQGYNGEMPVIDGTGMNGSGNSGLVNIQNVSYVKTIGFEIRNFTSNSSSFIPAGIYVSGNGSYIELRQNYVHNIITTVNDNTGNAFGIAIYGNTAPASINNLIIDGNEVASLQTGSSESITLNGNVDTFQVTNNKVHDNNNIGIDIIGFESTAPNPVYDQARNGLVSGNLVYNISSATNPAYGINQLGADGIYVDGGFNVVIERNIVHNTDYGVELASEHLNKLTSLVTLRSNLIYNSKLAGITLGGASSSNGGTSNCGIFNNTLYENDTTNSGTGEFALQNHVTQIQFENNLLVSSAQGLFINTQTNISASTLNGNLYFVASGANNSWNWNGGSYSSFSAYQAGTGMDSNGKYANPVLTSAGTGNFIPASGSPAIDSGVVITAAQAGTLDLVGHARVIGSGIDIGAIEQ